MCMCNFILKTNMRHLWTISEMPLSIEIMSLHLCFCWHLVLPWCLCLRYLPLVFVPGPQNMPNGQLYFLLLGPTYAEILLSEEVQLTMNLVTLWKVKDSKILRPMNFLGVFTIPSRWLWNLWNNLRRRRRIMLNKTQLRSSK